MSERDISPGTGATLPPALFIMGPTASGKTGLAIELLKHFPVELISVDSALVYRGMDIGTAKPDKATLAIAPHRLVDIREPWETYSAADFRSDALKAMEEITRAGRVPVLVGGTMLYFRALTEGLAPMPSADLEVRRVIEARARQAGWAALHDELALKDPETAARINPNDPQRIQRALEVIEITGKTMTELHRHDPVTPLPYRSLRMVVCPSERAELHRRIGLRFEQMMSQGFEEEMHRLRAKPGIHQELPAMRAVGYRQAWSWLDGDYDRQEMLERATAATRQLAKRQLTWLRREAVSLWYDLDEDNAVGGVVSVVQEFLDN